MAGGLSIIDSHAHLDYPQFEGQMDEVLARAQAEHRDRRRRIGAGRILKPWARF